MSKFLAVSLLALCAGCSIFRPYELNIQQGIVIDEDNLSRLRPGMTRNQVSFAMGTPLLTDALHADRWDYVYYTRVAGVVGQWRRIAIFFDGDKLSRVTGDITAPGAEPVATAPATGS